MFAFESFLCYIYLLYAILMNDWFFSLFKHFSNKFCKRYRHDNSKFQIIGIGIVSLIYCWQFEYFMIFFSLFFSLFKHFSNEFCKRYHHDKSFKWSVSVSFCWHIVDNLNISWSIAYAMNVYLFYYEIYSILKVKIGKNIEALRPILCD